MELCRYPCENKTRYFHIRAIQIPIVYNKYGDYDPDGLMYVLEKEQMPFRKKLYGNFMRHHLSLMIRCSRWC